MLPVLSVHPAGSPPGGAGISVAIREVSHKVDGSGVSCSGGRVRAALLGATGSMLPSFFAVSPLIIVRLVNNLGSHPTIFVLPSTS